MKTSMQQQDVFLRIRVTNTESRMSFIHNKVPLDHVECLRLSPNLKIEILGRSRGGRDEEDSADSDT
jgi:hypothetical protein